MERKRIEDANFENTGYSYTLSLISGKYKPVILYCLTIIFLLREWLSSRHYPESRSNQGGVVTV